MSSRAFGSRAIFGDPPWGPRVALDLWPRAEVVDGRLFTDTLLEVLREYIGDLRGEIRELDRMIENPELAAREGRTRETLELERHAVRVLLARYQARKREGGA